MIVFGFEFGFAATLLAIVLLIVQIYTLIVQAKKKQWVWFVLTLIFNITWIIYWIAKWLGKVK